MINLIHIYNLKANILQTLGPLPIYLLIFVVIYFIMIRPQVKQQKEHSDMLANIKKGDRVITKGGIVGNITNIKGKDKEIIEIEVNSNKIDILRKYINSIYTK
jgi:preprotein translocase subunit YajC